jgi:murein DD-endopeptidase MepM/ murein hydrolase activator NlpD
MRANRQRRPVSDGLLRRLLGVAVVVIALSMLATVALAAPIDLEEAEQDHDAAMERQVQRQHELDVLLSRIEALRVAREEQAAQVEQLEAQARQERQRADAARATVAEHYNQAYRTGTSGDPLVSIFGGADVDEVTERARVLSLLAANSQREREAAEGASARSAALSEQLQQATAVLADQTDELASQQDEAQEKVAAAQEDVQQIEQDIADEQERRAEAARRRAAREEARREAAEREAAEREAQEAAAEESSGGSGSGGGSGGAEVNGGIACPVGDPVSFSDTWGAARSGGRSHEGVDMLAPMGTPIYAYEDGVITSTSPSSLGGISLYLEGDSGNEYFYTHLSGFVSGISANVRVSAGQHIAHNGDSGNAAGIPHLHFEVRPGGGAKVNPYPYAKRACG